MDEVRFERRGSHAQGYDVRPLDDGPAHGVVVREDRRAPRRGWRARCPHDVPGCFDPRTRFATRELAAAALIEHGAAVEEGRALYVIDEFEGVYREVLAKARLVDGDLVDLEVRGTTAGGRVVAYYSGKPLVVLPVDYFRAMPHPPRRRFMAVVVARDPLALAIARRPLFEGDGECEHGLPRNLGCSKCTAAAALRVLQGVLEERAS